MFLLLGLFNGSAYADDKTAEEKLWSNFYRGDLASIKALVEGEKGTWISSKHADRAELVGAIFKQDVLNMDNRDSGIYISYVCHETMRGAVPKFYPEKIEVLKYFSEVAKESCAAGTERGCELVKEFSPLIENRVAALKKAEDCLATRAKAEADKKANEIRAEKLATDQAAEEARAEKKRSDNGDDILEEACGAYTTILATEYNLAAEKRLAKASGVTNLRTRYVNTSYNMNAKARLEELKKAYRKKSGKEFKPKNCLDTAE